MLKLYVTTDYSSSDGNDCEWNCLSIISCTETAIYYVRCNTFLYIFRSFCRSACVQKLPTSYRSKILKKI